MNNLNYGIIGNCTSAALISQSGSLDWACLPDFCSPSFFAKILDGNIGGSFEIIAEGYTTEQKYLENTNILSTTFTKDNDVFEVLDFMPRNKISETHYSVLPEIIRIIRFVSGSPKVRFHYNPKPGYAQFPVTIKNEKEYIKAYAVNGKREDYESLYLYTDLDKDRIINGEEFSITGDHFFLISYNQKLVRIKLEDMKMEFERTRMYWLEWVARTVRFKDYSDEIIRSALLLKLLSYQQSGAIIAAVTTSLPETIGEVRNWDYRYCWIRDSSMIITILINLGHYNVAERFLKFILDVVPYKKEKIQIMYGINRDKRLQERELSWLEGYEKSKPVRIGNQAYIQKQNDVYGVLLDVIEKCLKIYHQQPEYLEKLWTITRSLIRTVIFNWKKPDKGIWEYRSKKMHFVFSKTLCWVAMDRGVRIAERFEKHNYAKDWADVRDKIRKQILRRGWNKDVQAFTQAYENTEMDAANLLMANYGFIDYKDEKYKKTVMRIYEDLSKNDLMFRYKNKDDFGEPKSSFTVCSFWMVKSLYLIGEKKKAREMFEKLLSYSNHLGLFSEDISFEDGRLLGNFPQGYSHLALIDAAIVLSDYKNDQDDKPEILSVFKEGKYE